MKKQTKGMDGVISNLDKHVKSVESKALKGVVNASFFIERETDTTFPKVPVDLGNLRQSFFRETTSTATRVSCMLGYTANYAIYVHEKPNQKFQRPEAGYKWLEHHLFSNKKAILEIIQKEIKK